MKRRCLGCGADIPGAMWSECSACGCVNHFKVKPNGKVGKKACHPPGSKIALAFQDEEKAAAFQKK